ncbi:MAG TPA: amidohydrolase family protein, partial [Polyangiaceae bacterium]|nr:amidohydrolase family protein [Polyangiaceae bacterium]
LRVALADGTIDAIATDHAPHSALEKDCEFSEASPGMMGLELCFGLLSSLVGEGGLKLERLLDALSTRPARIAGIDPPTLRQGAVAELVLVDPVGSWKPARAQLHSKSHNTPFLERELKGKILMTLSHGTIVFDALGGNR